MSLPNVPVDRIGGQVRKTDYKQVTLLITAGVLYVLGWLPGRAVLGVRIVASWASHTWAGSALRVGFVDGYKPRHGR
jgi:hypothetical protein